MAFKLFGAALDALDDPERVDLKHAYIQADRNGTLAEGLPKDPYDVIAPAVASRCGDSVILGGKLDLPDWLLPRPSSASAPLVNPARYRSFIDRDEIADCVKACAGFVESEILPHLPCMICVDHGMTAGPLEGLAGYYDPRETTVLVLDAHFDAVPLHLRASHGTKGTLYGSRNCGSFLSALIDDGIVLPENLFVVGASDGPGPYTAEAYGKAYQSFLKRGVTVLFKEEVARDSFPDELCARLDKSRGRRLYVSLDADVGACSCMNAVRFLDRVGLQEAAILAIAKKLRHLIDTGRFELAGLDVAEVDIHLAGIEDDQGMPDRTCGICADFITTLVRNIA